MRTLPLALQERLESGVTTLCRCWRLDRLDGVSFGFTDHDEELFFDGVTFEPRSGATGSSLEVSDRLDVDNIEFSGALTSDAVVDADIDRGLFDGAAIRRWIVDWSAPDLRLLDFQGWLGEVRRRGATFEAELRGLSEPLSSTQGRQIIPTCDAVLGDARCGVDLKASAYRIDGAVAANDGAGRLRVFGLLGVEPGWFSGGRLLVAAGQSGGPERALELSIAAHERDAASGALGDRVELEETPIDALPVGLAVTLIVGCDKRLETCIGKFSNKLNFRGFPHVPGDDWVLAYPRSGDRNDGGSRSGG